jgi:transcription initiation factor TFIIE subunit alpha
LYRVKGKTPPQYGTLNEWTRAMKIRAARAGDADGHHHHGGGGGRGGLGVQTDDLEDTKFEVTLGLTKEQEEAMEAEANAPKAQPEWLRRNQARSPHTGSRTTASAWCTPILEEFVSRRLFLSAHPSLTIPTHLDAFQLRF